MMSPMPVFAWLPLLALALSLALHAASLALFPRLGLLDFPHRYGYMRERIPYPTGILWVVLFLALYLTLFPLNLQTGMTVAGVLLLGSVCVADDRRPLPPLPRFSFQIIVALLLFLGGARIFSFTNPLQGIVGGPVLLLDWPAVAVPFFGPLPLLSLLFTLFWLGLTINALNWFDGLAGHVSALSTIGFLTIGFLSLSGRVNQPNLALLAFLLAAICAGSLPFELPAQRLLIGDTGAMFAGLMLGLLTIYSGGKVATAFLVLGVPLLDLAIVITRRIAKGKSPLKGNARDEHLHHRLLRKGWSRGGIILLTTSLGTLFGLAALFMSTREKFLAAVILFLIMFLLSVYSRPRADT